MAVVRVEARRLAEPLPLDELPEPVSVDLGWAGSRGQDELPEKAPVPAGVGPLLLAGGVAGAASRTATAPLDRLKVIVQATGARQGLWRGAKRIYSEGGVWGFWRSNGTNVLKVAPETAVRALARARLRCTAQIKFFCYERIVAGLGGLSRRGDGAERLSPAVTKLLAGGFAGVTAQSVIYPLEILKTRLALMPRRVGLLATAREVIRRDGVRGMYRGLLPSTLGIFPYASIDLAVFNTLKDTYKAENPQIEPSVSLLLAFGAFSSTCGAVFAYPLQTVRTRLQAQGMQNHFELRTEHYDGMVDCFSKVVRKEGLMGLYRGLLPNLLKVLPAVSISYAVFEKTKALLLAR